MLEVRVRIEFKENRATPEELHQVVELAVNVATNGDRTSDFLDIALVR